jgi:hypothetical protein
MMRYLTCKEADGWNVRMAETEADDLQSTGQGNLRRYWWYGQLPIHLSGRGLYRFLR